MVKEIEQNLYPQEINKNFKTNLKKKLYYLIKKIVKEILSYGDLNELPKDLVFKKALDYVLKKGANYLTPESEEILIKY